MRGQSETVQVKHWVAWFAVLAASLAPMAGAGELLISVTSFKYGAPSGPVLMGLVYNDTGEKRVVRVAMGVNQPCEQHYFLNRWDEEHQWPKYVELEPKSWFSLVVPSGLTGFVDTDKCKALFDVLELTPERMVISPQVSTELSLKQGAPEISWKGGRSNYSGAISAVLEPGKDVERKKGEAVPMEVQILVVNRNADWRMVGLADRRLICKGSSIARWRLGRGEAMSGASAGPLAVQPGGWVVFSQRLMLSGNPTDCRVQFDVEEMRDEWSTALTLDAVMTPRAKPLPP